MVCAFGFPNRRFLAGLIGILSLLGLPSSLLAKSPMQKSQTPGYYRMMLGQFEVTALHDGMLDLDAALLCGISEPEIQNLLKRAFIDDPHKIPTSTNAYLINTGLNLILIDAGSGRAFGPALGDLSKNLRASGYGPEQVDFVLMTHLHPDHVGGLLDADGKQAYPKAVVYVSKAEQDYWFSDAEPENAPAMLKEHLKINRKLVRDMAGPYLASGQWKTFENADLPIAEVKAIAIPGHTPGHTAYEIQSDNQSLLVLGDTLHCAPVQFARPDPAVVFAFDAKQAVASRETIFGRIADSKTSVAGMHISFPGIGHIHADGQNAYAWVPVEYSSVMAVQPPDKVKKE
jgi:glyoxylase-like metal-dependent hydrolase (beta-lactamase superfamily II)